MSPAKTWISLGICPVWSESSLVHMKKAWVLSYPFSIQRRLIRLGGFPGWSESSLGAQIILLVLSWGGSFICLYLHVLWYVIANVVACLLYKHTTSCSGCIWGEIPHIHQMVPYFQSYLVLHPQLYHCRRYSHQQPHNGSSPVTEQFKIP